MSSNIYEKMAKMREAIKKEQFSSFPELLKIIDKKAKYYKVLPLYCFYDKLATLSIVDMDEITMVIKFQIPVELVGLQNVKQHLYKMAFDIEGLDECITAKQYVELLDRMKQHKVTEKEILERYRLQSLADMTVAIYQRCMSVLDKMSNRQQT